MLEHAPDVLSVPDGGEVDQRSILKIPCAQHAPGLKEVCGRQKEGDPVAGNVVGQRLLESSKEDIKPELLPDRLKERRSDIELSDAVIGSSSKVP